MSIALKRKKKKKKTFNEIVGSRSLDNDGWLYRK